MTSAIYNRYGGIEVIELSELVRPIPQKGEVILKMKAMSINPRDYVSRNGDFKLFTGSKFPKLLGADFSGTIHALGEGVRDFKVGDQVFGYIDSFSFAVSAQYIRMPVKYLALKPNSITHQQAATLGCAYLTALQALRDKAKVKKGDEILIYGAAGGVGTAAIQIAKYFGAIVTAVSNSRNELYCLQQGADFFIAYDKANVFLENKKYDTFFQVFSKKNEYNNAKNILKPKANFVSLLFNPFFLLKKLFSKYNIIVFLVRSNTEDLMLLSKLTAEKKIEPFISNVFKIDEIVAAYSLAESNSHTGKIIIEME